MPRNTLQALVASAVVFPPLFLKRRFRVRLRPEAPAPALAVLFALAACGEATGPRDTTAPTLTLSAPSVDTTLARPQLQVTGMASDDVAITRVTFSSGAGAEQEVQVTRGMQVRFDFALPELAPGVHTLVVAAYDGAGNRVEVRRRVEHAPPSRYVARPLVEMRWEYSHGYTITAGGSIPGLMMDADSMVAWVWQDGRMRILPQPKGFTRSFAQGVNRHGVPVGGAEQRMESARVFRAIRWDGDTPVDLGTLGGPSALAYDINDAGDIVGWATVSLGTGERPFLWKNGQMVNLGTFGGRNGLARRVNNQGQVVGGAANISGRFRAFRWQNGQLTDLGTLPDHVESYATGINDRGAVVGGSFTATNIQRAFLWENGRMIDLGTVGALGESAALGINDLNQVVGNGVAEAPKRSAPFLWMHGAMFELDQLLENALEWELYSATGINNAGQISATGKNRRTGIIQALVLTPVPSGTR